MTPIRKQAGSEPAPRANHPTDRLVAEVAWLYYVRGLNQGEVAKLKNLSRPTIINYLRIANDRGLVSIKLKPEHLRVNELGHALADRFGLIDVYVVSDEGVTGRELTRAVSEAAAHVLPGIVSDRAVLGVSWGETISLLAEALPYWPIRGLVVRQLIGSMANPVMLTSESCTTEIARRLGGVCINMNAPAVCTSSDLANQLRAEPIIAEQLENIKSCTHAIFSQNPCSMDAHVVQFKVATEKDIAYYKARGAVCNLIGRFLDENGDQVRGPLDDRLFAMQLADLKNTQGMLVVAGDQKAEGTRAILRGGYANRLVLDATQAERVLAMG